MDKLTGADVIFHCAKQKFVLDINEILNFDFPMDEQFELEINYNNVKYEFLVKFSSVKKGLICFGPAAYNPNDFSPPIYIRHSWHKDIKSSTLFYNDPTTYNYDNSKEYMGPDHRVGWGAGKLNDYYLENIGKIIKILADYQNIPNDTIIFFGSSAGGFCSIMLATMLKRSVAIVNNPRTILDKNAAAFKDLLNYCFEGNEENISMCNYRFDVVEMFKKEKYMPYILYFLNIRSPVDVNGSCIPLVESLKCTDFAHEKMQIVLYSDDAGHMGFYPKKNIIPVLEDILSSNNVCLKMNQIQSFQKIDRQLQLKKQQIAELQTVKGYLNYKIRNIYQRLKGNLIYNFTKSRNHKTRITK